eukprot:3940049-Rhodomonas_salina.1
MHTSESLNLFTDDDNESNSSGMIESKSLLTICDGVEFTNRGWRSFTQSNILRQCVADCLANGVEITHPPYHHNRRIKTFTSPACTVSFDADCNRVINVAINSSNACNCASHSPTNPVCACMHYQTRHDRDAPTPATCSPFVSSRRSMCTAAGAKSCRQYRQHMRDLKFIMRQQDGMVD